MQRQYRKGKTFVITLIKIGTNRENQIPEIKGRIMITKVLEPIFQIVATLQSSYNYN